MAAALAAGLTAGTASAQTTASGRSVAGAPIGTTGTPRAGTGIPSQEEGRAGAARGATAQAPAEAGQVRGRAVGVAPAAPGQGIATVEPGATFAMNDGLFAAAASGAGLCEVASARLALERAAGADVKRFAQRMIDDHTKANKELTTLAAEKRMLLPTNLPIPAQADLSALSGVTGEEFDKCYIKQQMAAHICAVGLFEAEARRGTDPQLKAWAAQTLPTLKEHKMHVKKMHDECEAKEKSAAPATR